MRLFRFPVFVCFLLMGVSPARVEAQFTPPFIFGDGGNENGYHLLSDDLGGFFIAGTVDATFTPLTDPLPEFGQEDIFLGRIDGAGNWLWAKSCGSFLDDEIRVMRLMPDGGLLLTGTFWLEFSYDDQKLSTTDNIEGIFILRLDEQGAWQWGRVINGTNLKGVQDVKIGPEGEIYLTGHFAETLKFEGLELEASGKNDAFLLQLDPEGALRDWQQLGYKGATRGQTIALHPEGGFFWGGVYDDTLRLDTTELYANTFDRDVFISRFDATGEPLWIKRAGGVFEEELIAMEVDESGDLLATGFLIGVMTLSEDLSVQSRNGNPDIFMFRYQDNGEPVWARTVGGALIDLPTDLCLRETELLISGTYQEEIAWDNLSSPTSGGVNGFIAGFDVQSGNSRWLAPVSTDDFAFVEALDLDESGRLFALGSFSGTAHLGGYTITSPGQYDVFLTEVDPSISPAFSPEAFPGLQIFPNPAAGLLYIRAAEDQRVNRIQIFDGLGRNRWTSRQQLLSVPINVSALEPGIYHLVIYRDKKFTTKTFSIARP